MIKTFKNNFMSIDDKTQSLRLSNFSGTMVFYVKTENEYWAAVRNFESVGTGFSVEVVEDVHT